MLCPVHEVADNWYGVRRLTGRLAVHVPTVNAGSRNRVSPARPDHCCMLHLIFTFPTRYFSLEWILFFLPSKLYPITTEFRI